VIAGDPDPGAPGDQRQQPGAVGLGQRAGAGVVVEAVAEADDAGRREGGDLAGQALERLGALVRRQQGAAAAGEPLGAAEVQVGDTEQAFVRPPERTGGPGDQPGACERQRPPEAGAFRRLRDRS
jgi:hypothetical protein